MPKISVCMPTFNRADRVSNAISSILTQSYTDFEFIIVDDASTDETAAMLSKIRDRRVKVIRNAENQGVLRSRDIAYAAASGEYIALMDSDDVSYSNRLALECEALDAGYDFVGSWVDMVDVATGNRSTWKMASTQTEILADLFFKNCFPNPAMMVRRRALKTQSLSFVNDYFPSADYFVWSTLSRRPGLRFKNIPQPLLLKRNHSGNVTAIHNESQLEKASEVRRIYLESWHVFSQRQIDLLLAVSTLDPIKRLDFDELVNGVREPLRALSEHIEPKVLLAAFEHAFSRYVSKREDWDSYSIIDYSLDPSPIPLSVIVTTFNDFYYLPQALDSVLANAPADIQVIVVDDGSHDAVLDVMAPYLEEPRVRLIRQSNAGLSAARNAGIDAATGQYITFLDADDHLAEDFFDRMLSAAAKTSADVIVGAHIAFDEMTGEESVRFMPEATRVYSGGIIFRFAKREFGYMAQNKLYKRSLFSRIRFWPNIVHEDELFCVEIFSTANRVLTIKHPTYYYRQRQGSITKTLSRKHVRSFMLILARLHDLKSIYPNLDGAPWAFDQIEDYLVTGIVNKVARVPNKAELLETEAMASFFAARITAQATKTLPTPAAAVYQSTDAGTAKIIKRIEKLERGAHKRMDELVLKNQLVRYIQKPWISFSKRFRRAG